MENIKSNEAISKRDRGRILILGGSLGTTFTVKNCAEAAMRAGAGLVVACVKEELVPILESNSGKFKIKKICGYNMDSARKVLDLLEQSNTMVLGMGIEENILKKSKFFLEIINNTSKQLVIDADLIELLIHKKKEYNPKNIPHVITMNIKETDKYFGNKVPPKKKLIKEAQNLSSRLVIKSNNTKIISPEGEYREMKTNGVPEMTVAGSGDVLAGIIGSYIGQGIKTKDAIFKAIKLREEAARFYIKKTGDIVAHPQDIINSIPYVHNKI